MSKTIVVVGFGPGVSAAVAERFAREGFAVALVARGAAKLEAGVKRLEAGGFKAAAYPADASDPASLRKAIARASAELGPVGVLHWNAFSGQGVGGLLTAEPESVKGAFDVAVVGLLAAVQAALPDLRASKGALLVTNGAYGDLNPMIDGFAVAMKAEGVALANAAKAKLVGLLSAELKAEGVFVGEVTIAGVVKGTGPESPGVPTLAPQTIAEAFFQLYDRREEMRSRVG